MKKIYILLIFIVIMASILRIYRIESVPPSLSWDEVAVGYNAFTVANWGKDEYGKSYPLNFRSFGEDKQPIHIYTTAIFVKLFGLSEFSTRIPAAIMGSLNVLLIFFLAKKLFRDERIGLFSSFFLAISPQNLFFSRFNHEANFALFFFMLGLLIIHKVIQGKSFLLPFSLLAFLLAMVSYHAAEVVVPPVILLLFILYFKSLVRNKASVLLASFLLGGFIILGILSPRVLGIVRYNQAALSKSDFGKTILFKYTHNYFLGRINLILEQYSWHFDPKFLFISGDKNPRLSSQSNGEFYLIDAIFLLAGVAYLISKRSKSGLVLLSWALLGPLPSSLVSEAPHAGRAAFMMGSWQIIAALGLYFLLNLFRKKIFRITLLVIVFIISVFSLSKFMNFYLNDFAKDYAIQWQYGMKQIIEFVTIHPEYSQIYTTNVRAQPYIFFLYYLKTPLPDYLNTVIYNNSRDKSSSNVSYFDKYAFGGWSPFESEAQRGVLYVLSPSEYDGLKYRSTFDIKKIIYYPNETIAFFLVSLK